VVGYSRLAELLTSALPDREISVNSVYACAMLRLRLLGELTIELDGRSLEPPTSRRARALLGWLALERGMHARSRLAARFWPDVLDESARTSLRSALSGLRRALGPDSEQYLIAGRDDVGLAGDSLVWTDVEEFERCLAQARLEEALELCCGELLAGLDDDWVYERRDEHRGHVAEVLARLAASAERNQDLQSTIGYTRRQVALDPLAEEPQRDLMRRLAAGGDRAGAIRTYERLSQRLRDELRIAPSQATRELAETLRHGGETEPSSAPTIARESPAAVVTLLFTDLVGSTALLDELGDDAAERLRRVHFALLRDVATGYSGEEVKNLGDGLMVAFPSVVNALSCAVGIQQAVYRHNAREGDDRLRVRVGLHVGEPIRDEGDYFGTPVVVAKRLCDKADGGQILASELVRALAGSRGSFGFQSRGPLGLEGFSEPLPVVEIEWEPAAERRIGLPAPLVLGEAAPLVGRDAQLAQLSRRWEDVLAGNRRVAMLVGEPGIGKTRLAAEFCRGSYENGALVLLGRCYEESLVPYQSFVEALRHYVSECPPDELRRQVGRHRETLAKLLAELADPGSRPTGTLSAETSEREQFLLFDAVASLLVSIADTHPLILVLDDLHWADAPTLLLLRHVARATESAPMLILGSYRQTEVDQAHPLQPALEELRRARALESLTLGGLGEQEVAELISSAAGRAAPAAVSRSIANRTQGNPFFVEELLRDVSAGEDLTEIGIPQSVKDLLLRRLRRLDEDCKTVLTIAAVSGREFTLDELTPVVDLSADQVAETLERAIAAHIVDESAGAIGRYSFAHALIREAIYEQISLTRRARLHRKIGEAIEGVRGEAPDGYASALAYHFSAAGEVEKAYEYNSLAAAAAERVYAVEPALAHYTAALDAGAELGLDPDRDPAVRRLRLQRGKMRARSGDLHGASNDFDAALKSARRSRDRVIEMETLNDLGIAQLRSDLGAAAKSHEAALEIAAQLDDTAAQTNALDRLAVISSHLLEFDRGLELGERALELARGTGEDAVVGRATDSIKLAVWQLGDLARLEELTSELVGLWRERGDLWYLQFTLQESAFVSIGRARWDEAAERLTDALGINRRIGDTVAEALTLDAHCWLHRSRGAYDEALSAGRAAVALASDVGWAGWAAATLGWTLLDLRAPGPAAEVLERGLALGEQFGAPNEIVRCLSQLAWARWLLGAHAEASELADRAERLLHGVSVPPGSAFLFGTPAYAAVARVLLAAGAPERGEALLRPVLEAAERSGWHEAAASSAVVVGLCMEALGEVDGAVAALARAAELADKHGIPAPGWEAHAALARLSGDGDPHLAAADAIVGRMIAGLTDDALRAGLGQHATP
jgi:class 3 adenylate cyclase/tetratricopeptide (TPR) repeat protein